MTRTAFAKKTSSLYTMWVVWLVVFMFVVTPSAVFVLNDVMGLYEEQLRLRFGAFARWALSSFVVGGPRMDTNSHE